MKKLIFCICFLFQPVLLFCNQEELTSIRQELDVPIKLKDNNHELLNVSYDPTREFYEEYNELFKKWWKKKTSRDLKIIQSHGGSGKQARSIIAGLEADVVTLALAFDIDSIENLTGLIGKNWQQRLPYNSSPYYSTIVFLVRKGNPKEIKDWQDLSKKNVNIIMPNPKTSGGARWTYLAMWAFASEQSKGNLPKTIELMKKIYANAPVLDTGARSASTTFIQRKLGDVLITWENEAYIALEKIGKEDYEIIYPSISIKAEPPVTWIEKNMIDNKTEQTAKSYLKYLYSKEAQELIAKYHFRPVDEKYGKKFPKIKMKEIADYGNWQQIQIKHFEDKALFDQIYLSEEKKVD